MLYFVVNPASRSGRGAKYWEKLEPILKERQVEYKVFFSQAAGDLSRITRELTSGITEEVHLVIMGGDGSVNEALQGLENISLVRFSYIPTGSSNDLARDLKLTTDPIEGLNRILDDMVVENPQDIGVLHYNTAYEQEGAPDTAASVSDHRFLVSIGIGFDAAVCEESLTSSIKPVLNKIGLGKLTYLGIALKLLIASKNPNAIVTVTDAEGNTRSIHAKKIRFAAFMCHRYEGGGFMFCPFADAADGLLEMCAVHELPTWKVLRVLPTAYTGKHLRFKGVEYGSITSAQVTSDMPMWVHTDGEVYYMSDNITVRTEAEALRFYC